MSESLRSRGETGPSHRAVEIGVALGMALFAVIGIAGSLRVGIGWAAEGPQAGFFPFYVSLVVLLSCCINLVQILRDTEMPALFATWGQLWQVFAVIVPTTAFVFLVPVLGMYVSSMLLIAAFMKWLGRYGWPLVVLIAVGVPVLTYVMFEWWFLVPLPKGPVEDWLGL